MDESKKIENQLAPEDELLIVELDERVEFSTIPLDADTEANTGCTNTSSCSSEDSSCTNGSHCG